MCDPCWVKVGVPGELPRRSITWFRGCQPLTGSFQLSARQMGVGARKGEAGREEREKGGIGSRLRKRQEKERGRCEERREDGRERGKEPETARESSLALGAPPDSARGLFIEILSYCEILKQLKLGEIRNKSKRKESKIIPPHLM